MFHCNIGGRRAAALLASTAVIFTATAAIAGETAVVCSTPKVDRSVEVIRPTYGNAVCKVLYRKPDEGAPDQFLWRSNDSMASCEQKANELVASLRSEGFNCVDAALQPANSHAAPGASASISSAATPQDSGRLSATLASASGDSNNGGLPSGGVPYQRIGDKSDTSWHLAGYADATFIVSDFDGQTTADFDAARFNPAFHFQYKDLVLMEAEAEISVDGDGETEFELEYAQADIFLHDSAVLVVGQFLSPVGQFQERLHPTWINRMANPPPGFAHDGVQPTSEVGAMLRGGVSIGQAIATYAVAVGNGPRLGHEGGVVFEGTGGDDNPDKALSGRLGILPLPYLEIGGSFLTGKVSGMAMPDEVGGLAPSDADVTLWGADAAYTRGSWDVRAEYLNATRDPINTLSDETDMVEALPKLKLEAWYGQIAYSLSGLTENKILQRFEPAVRYGEYKVAGLDELAEEAAEKRLSIGLNYWLAPSIVTRGVLELRDFTAREEDDPMSSETRFLLQFAYGF